MCRTIMTRVLETRDLIPLEDIQYRQRGDQGWTVNDYIEAVNTRNRIVLVAEHNQRAVASLVMSFKKTTVQLIDLLADQSHTWTPEQKRITEICLLTTAQRVLRPPWRSLMMRVRESDLRLQLLLRDTGFLAVYQQPEYYQNGEDAYLFRKMAESSDILEPDNEPDGLYVDHGQISS